MARILIVDDDAEIRYMMRIIVERAGHEVGEADNGASALQAMHVQLPDLVITDVVMPVMNGQQLVARLRANESTREIPIVAVSAHKDLHTDADAWLDKPFLPDRLVKTVEKLLPRHADSPEGTLDAFYPQ